MRRRQFLITASAVTAVTPGHRAIALPSALTVQSDFPGGSAKVLGIDQVARRIRIASADHPGRGWPVWWYFRVDGLTAGETVTLEVNARQFGRPDRAAFSHDGVNWMQTEPGEQSRLQAVYQHKAQTQTLWFAWGPPFTLRDANALIGRIVDRSPDTRRFDLGPTREGRPVPGVVISRPGPSRAAVWIQARSHAWEAGSSWVGIGLAEWIGSDDPVAERLRQRADVYVVPILDVDAVEIGAGGKGATPCDPNQDWGPHAQFFPQVKNAMDRVKALEAQRRLEVFIDLHNPGRDALNHFFYIPAQPLLTPVRNKWQDRFLALAREELSGPYGFQGRLGPSGATYDAAVDRSSDSWAASISRDEVITLTLEVAWNTPGATQGGYRELGRNLGHLIERYLREKAAST